MRGCALAIAIVGPFWLGSYIVLGLDGLLAMIAAGAVVEAVLFHDDWIGALRRFAAAVRERRTAR